MHLRGGSQEGADIHSENRAAAQGPNLRGGRAAAKSMAQDQHQAQIALPAHQRTPCQISCTCRPLQTTAMFTSSSKRRAAAEQSLQGPQSLNPSLSQVSVDRLKLSPRLGIGPVNAADDGDPLDIVVIHDATSFSGLVVTCRVIGIHQIEQKSNKKSGT